MCILSFVNDDLTVINKRIIVLLLKLYVEKAHNYEAENTRFYSFWSPAEIVDQFNSSHNV